MVRCVTGCDSGLRKYARQCLIAQVQHLHQFAIAADAAFLDLLRHNDLSSYFQRMSTFSIAQHIAIHHHFYQLYERRSS